MLFFPIFERLCVFPTLIYGIYTNTSNANGGNNGNANDGNLMVMIVMR